MSTPRAKEDGPGTWEALLPPRGDPVRRRPGDHSPREHTEAEACVFSGRTSLRSEVGPSEGNRSEDRRGEGVGGPRSSGDVGEGLAHRPGRAKAARAENELLEGTMAHASTWEPMSTGLREVAERARREPEGRFHSLAHPIDQAALERAYPRPP